jgi:hypothetical protein
LRARLAYRISALALTFAILCGHASADTSLHVRAAVDAMSEVLASGGADVDGVLCKLGYCAEYTSQIADWHKLSPYRQIETMVLAADKAERGSAEDALALMAHALARDYPSILHHEAIVEIAARPPRRTLAFATLAAASPARLAPRLDAAVYAIAQHVDEGTMAISKVLHAAGVPDDTIMTLVREHRDARDVMRAAVAKQPLARRATFLSDVVNAIARHHPTIVEHHAIKALHASLQADHRVRPADPDRRPGTKPDRRPPPAPPSTGERSHGNDHRPAERRPARENPPRRPSHPPMHRR